MVKEIGEQPENSLSHQSPCAPSVMCGLYLLDLPVFGLSMPLTELLEGRDSP
jgi:hypothetical protein